jgi:hypothetical protein
MQKSAVARWSTACRERLSAIWSRATCSRRTEMLKARPIAQCRAGFGSLAVRQHAPQDDAAGDNDTWDELSMVADG